MKTQLPEVKWREYYHWSSAGSVREPIPTKEAALMFVDQLCRQAIIEFSDDEASDLKRLRTALDLLGGDTA